MFSRHTPSQRRGRGRAETEDLVHDLQILIASERNKPSRAEDRSEVITLHPATLRGIDNLLRKGEVREAFVSIAIEREIRRRQSEAETEKQRAKNSSL